jgi:hypothetical protein
MHFPLAGQFAFTRNGYGVTMKAKMKDDLEDDLEGIAMTYLWHVVLVITAICGRSGGFGHSIVLEA